MTETFPIGEPDVTPNPATAPRAEIEYVVLFSDGSAGAKWTLTERLKAKSPDAAIEAFIGDNDPGTDMYVAVASRYWSPQSYGVEVETIRKLVPGGKS